MALIKVFFWGMLISFLGTLPLSPLNISAMQISTGEGIANATWFSIGTLLTEMIYVRISVAGINWLQKQKSFFKWMEWITVFLILALAFGSFYAASHKHETGNIILHNNINRFLLGMFMSAITVMHIPFWFGWTTILFSKKILQPGNLFYNVYTIAIGTGTFLANCIFIYGGFYIVKKLTGNQHLINLGLAWVFLLTAVIQLIKIIWVKPKEDKLPGNNF